MSRARRAAALLVCAALLFCGVPALARDAVKLPELHLELTPPEGWEVLTRGVKADDPALERLGLEKGELDRLFEQGAIYCDMVGPGASAEVVVSMVENENTRAISDMSGAPEKRLRELEDALSGIGLEQIAHMGGKDLAEGVDGVSYRSAGRYKHPQALFITMEGHVEQEGMEIALLQNLTIINGQQLTLTYRAYDGALDDAAREVFRQVSESIRFTEDVKTDGPGRPWNLTPFIAVILMVLVLRYLRHRGRKQPAR